MSLTSGTFTARLKLHHLDQVYLPGDSISGDAFEDEDQIREYIQRGWVDVDNSGTGETSAGTGEFIIFQILAKTIPEYQELDWSEFTVTHQSASPERDLPAYDPEYTSAMLLPEGIWDVRFQLELRCSSVSDRVHFQGYCFNFPVSFGEDSVPPVAVPGVQRRLEAMIPVPAGSTDSLVLECSPSESVVANIRAFFVRMS